MEGMKIIKSCIQSQPEYQLCSHLFHSNLPPHVLIAQAHQPITYLHQVLEFLAASNLILHLQGEKGPRNWLEFPGWAK